MRETMSGKCGILEEFWLILFAEIDSEVGHVARKECGEDLLTMVTEILVNGMRLQIERI